MNGARWFSAKGESRMPHDRGSHQETNPLSYITTHLTESDDGVIDRTHGQKKQGGGGLQDGMTSRL